jgi:hypothetical protein
MNPNILVLLLVGTEVVRTASLSPDGPTQQCQDDAGPPWGDDSELFGSGAYHDGTYAVPVLTKVW